MSKHLSAEQKLAVSRIGGLVVINAMIFQEILAGIDKRVLPLKKFFPKPTPLTILRSIGNLSTNKLIITPSFISHARLYWVSPPAPI